VKLIFTAGEAVPDLCCENGTIQGLSAYGFHRLIIEPKHAYDHPYGHWKEPHATKILTVDTCPIPLDR
jgi:hypothetical protein